MVTDFFVYFCNTIKKYKNMIYLAHLKVTKSYYEGKTSTSEQFHIVEAESQTEVETKVEKYYEDKHDPYYLSYKVEFVDVNEMIS